MTTIVYDHKNKQIACDSRTTCNDIIVDDKAIKYIDKGDKLWFCSGSTGDFETFINHYEPLTKTNPHISADAIFLIKEGDCIGGVYLAIIDRDDVYKECIMNHNQAVGSGSNWALAALDMGKTAKEAVEYALTKDVYSGGKIHVYDIEKAKFI